MIAYLNELISRFLQMERSPERLARSVTVGTFSALSPYIGVHTAMVVVGSWLFRASIPVGFITCHVINNPWTVGPLVVSQYFLGRAVVLFCGWGELLHNPGMVQGILDVIREYVPVPNLCFWSFMIGSHLMAIAVSGILYPVLLHVLRRNNADDLYQSAQVSEEHVTSKGGQETSYETDNQK